MFCGATPSDWRFRLSVSGSKLEEIEMQIPRASDRKLEAMNIWLKRDLNASWEKFVETLRSLRMNPLAHDAEGKYCKPPAAAADKPGSARADLQPTPTPQDLVDMTVRLLCPRLPQCVLQCTMKSIVLHIRPLHTCNYIFNC